MGRGGGGTRQYSVYKKKKIFIVLGDVLDYKCQKCKCNSHENTRFNVKTIVSNILLLYSDKSVIPEFRRVILNTPTARVVYGHTTVQQVIIRHEDQPKRYHTSYSYSERKSFCMPFRSIYERRRSVRQRRSRYVRRAARNPVIISYLISSCANAREKRSAIGDRVPSPRLGKKKSPAKSARTTAHSFVRECKTSIRQ